MSQQFLPWDPTNPMNKSMYLEDQYPLSYEEVHNYVQSYPNPANPNMPQPGTLKPQPTKDSWYYSNDGRDDGHISTFEKLKAFVKGGTYNLVKGMFCNENGFSWKRTLLSAGAATAIALTGAAGLAVAGTLGIVSAVNNFIHSTELAKNAKTDQDARDAYEGIGESASTAGLSVWAGWKGYKGLASKWFGKKTTVPPVETPPGREAPVPPGGEAPVPPGGETPPVRPVRPKTPRKRTAGPKKTSKPKVKKTPVKKTPSVAQARSYTDRIHNIDTTPNTNADYFYYGNPTNRMPDLGYNEPNHFFG